MLTINEFVTALENWKTLTRDCTPAERGAFFDFVILVYFLPFSGVAYENGVSLQMDAITSRLGGSETAALLASLILKGHIQIWTPTSLAALHVTREDLVPAFPIGTLYIKRLVIDEAERMAAIA